MEEVNMGRRPNNEGSVFYDKSGDRWIAAVTVGGKRRKAVAATEDEAHRRLRQLLGDAERGKVLGDGNVTVAAVCDLWESRVLAGRDASPSTVATYVWCLDAIREELGRKRLRTLTVDDVETALDRLAAGKRKPREYAPGKTRTPLPMSRASLVKIRSTLGQVLDMAVRRDLVNRNVARIAELTPTARRGGSRRSLTPAEARKFTAQLREERLGAMFLLALSVALRPGEAAGVLWDDLDLEVGTLTVRHAVRLEQGRAIIVEDLKTSGSHRTLDLPAPVVAALKSHRKEQTAQRLSSLTWEDPRLVFSTSRGTPLEPSNVRRELEGVCKRAGVPVITPNELRHSGASLLADAGVPIERIADLMGHRSTRMLDQTYRHRVRSSVDAAVAVMDDLLAEEG
jgi:integrase